MAFLDDLSVGSASPDPAVTSGVTDASPLVSGIPSYMVGADTHSIANGQGSLLDPSTWGNTLLNDGKFFLSATTRAVASAWNIVPTAANWLGGDFDKVDTGEVLRAFDDDLGKYYEDNKGSVDIVGDIASMFVPGTAGIKVLNWGQKAIKLAAEGRAGWNMARAFGTLPDAATRYGKLAAEEISAQSATFSWINTNTIKSLAAGYGQNVLEVAAFETAAAVTMRDSPMFQDHDVKDIAYNAILGGGLIGGGIMGTLSAAKTFGVIRKGVKEADLALKDVTHITQMPEGSAASDRILAGMLDLDVPPVLDSQAANYAARAKLAKQRENRITIQMLNDSHALAGGDVELGNMINDSLKGLDITTAHQNLAGLQSVSRATAVSEFEAAALKAEEVANKPILKEATKLAVKAFNKGDVDEVGYQKIIDEYMAGKKVSATVDTKHLDLHTGQVYRELPPEIFSLADKMKGGQKEILEYVKGLKFKEADNWSPLVAKSADEVEARYIWASRLEESPTTVYHTDLPLLERAYKNGEAATVRFGDKVEDTIQMRGNDLLNHITDTKNAQYKAMLDATSIDLGVAGKTTTAEMARKLNTSIDYLEGTQNVANPAADLFYMQNAADELTKRAIANGTLKEGEKLEPWFKPRFAKLTYDTSVSSPLDGMVVDAMTYLKGQRLVTEQAAANVFASYAKELTETFVEGITDAEVLLANRYGAGAGFATSASANYGSLGAKVELIGKSTSNLEKRAVDTINTTFAPHLYALKNNTTAGLEFAKVVQLMRQTPEKYIYDATKGALVNRELAKYESKIAAGKKAKEPEYIDPTAPKEIPLESEEMRKFVADWLEHNDSQLTHRMELRNQQGLQVQDNRGTFYIPPPDPKSFPYHAFVVDPTVTATGHVKMIWAKSPEELQALAARVPPEFEVHYKRDTVEYFKAKKEYDYDLGVNENYIDSAMARTGVAAPFFPKTDASVLIDEMMEWRTKADKYLAKEMVYNKYSAAFMELEKLGQQYTSVATSTAKGARALADDEVANPFADYVKTALNVSRRAELPIWTPLNNLVEKAFSTLAGKVDAAITGAKSHQDLDAINNMFEKAGIKTVPYDNGMALLANHTAPKPVLSQFVRASNSLLSTLMLRADPLNALNNGIGANVLLGAETKSLIRAIQSGNKEAAGELAGLAEVAVPGAGGDSITSASKLIANSYGNWWKKVIGNEDAGALAAEYRKQGWLTSISDQVKEMTTNLALKGTESPVELQSRMSKALEITKSLGSKAEKWTGNSFAEEMNRFVAADVARQISDVGIKAGVISADDAKMYINTFINRTQGNYLASQRPLMFQGPIGQAIGLFQTYQFNMLQQVFRHVSEGSSKDAALLMALQGSIYGMNGLPAFNAINNHLVGTASGNTNHRDIVSTTYDVAGKEGAEWLLYGVSSNLFLHPDLKLNMYSRGDINPRQLTVVPTNIADVPIVGAFGKFIGAVKTTAEKIGSGGNAWPAILQGIEHSGISRPLAGIAQVSEAFVTPAAKSFTTTTQGNIVMQNDLMSLANLGRLAGGKPLDEAVTRDALFRVQAYESAKNKEIKELGAAIKSTTIGGGVPSTEQINGFAAAYAKAGGKQQHFSAFMHKTIMHGNTSQANEIVKKLNNPNSQYMQKIMGGMEIADFTNSSTTTADAGQGE